MLHATVRWAAERCHIVRFLAIIRISRIPWTPSPHLISPLLPSPGTWSGSRSNSLDRKNLAAGSTSPGGRQAGKGQRVNCSFYFKIGACRHGDRCSRLHNKPTFSQTIVLLNLYRNPQNTAQTADGSHCHVSDVEVQEHYDNFFEEVFTELQEKYGEIEEMNVCDNLGDHLVGNVYVKFRREEDAERAVAELNNRWFNGQAVHAELSPVTDFRESCCRQYEMGECTRGGFCNFMHLRPISRNLRRQLYGRGPRHRSPPRSHTGHRPRERNRRRSPDHRHGRF
ncbi:splicing factor U2AF 26 kDa subunit isoform X1 [Phodopus roborovskii]|nr:splicing factor U2AF 26 kDa subunit isoform X1 [Phodopus roborovskii]